MNLEKQKNFLIHFAFWGVIGAGIFFLLKFTLAFLFPFFMAFLIASILDRPIRALARLMGGRHRAPAAILTVILFYLVTFSLFALAGIRAGLFLRDLFLDLPRLYYGTVEPAVSVILQGVEEQLQQMSPEVVATLGDLSDSLLGALGDFVSGVSVAVIGGVSAFAATLPGFFVNFLITIIVTFFLAVDYPGVTAFLTRQLPERALHLWQDARNYVGGTLLKCIASYALICSITFCELWLGLTLLGIPNAPLIALGIAIFDILPVLGTGGIMIPWALIAAIIGNGPLALGLLAVYLVITVVRQTIEPRIVGKQVGLHPVVTLASMVLGLQLFGGVGLFALPILLSLVKNLNDKGIIHILK
jgi:sporulation integral membrane protein YtvI